MNRGYAAWMLAGFLLSGLVPAQAAMVINEVLADPHPDDLLGDANGDGTRNATEDEFVELVNTGGSDLNLEGWTLRDSVTVRFTFPMGTVVPTEASVVVFGGGDPSGIPGLVFASTGGLLLNNSGDTLILADAADTEIAAFTYGAEGGADQSLTRSPDLTGDFVLHADVAPRGARFSPGTRLDGTPFAVPLPSALMFFVPAVFTLVPFRRRRGKVIGD